MIKKDLLKEMFTQELSEQERTTLTVAIENAAIQTFKNSKSIFLEGFGILSPLIEKNSLNLALEGQNLRRSVKFNRLTFHKCSELTSFYREKYPLILEERDFAETVYSKLPLQMQVKWPITQTRQYLRGFIELFKHEVITQGYSQRLKALGEFYSLHNRQGNQFGDWYAGANIIFKSNCDYEISCDECKIYDKPTLTNAHELMSCIYGKPLHIFTINLEKELAKLGFDLDGSLLDGNHKNDAIQVAIFANKIGNQQQLIYCSEGLRLLALDPEKADNKNTVGNELVFQVAYDNDFRESSKNSPAKLDDLVLPDWPKTVFVMGWIMLQSSKLKSIKIGSGLSLNSKLCNDVLNSKLTAIFATKFHAAQSEQNSPEGAFNYINLVGISQEEYKLAESYSANHLLTLLKFKKLDQVSKLCRPSILTRTSFLDLQSVTLAPAASDTLATSNNTANGADVGI